MQFFGICDGIGWMNLFKQIMFGMIGQIFLINALRWHNRLIWLSSHAMSINSIKINWIKVESNWFFFVSRLDLTK